MFEEGGGWGGRRWIKYTPPSQLSLVLCPRLPAPRSLHELRVKKHEISHCDQQPCYNLRVAMKRNRGVEGVQVVRFDVFSLGAETVCEGGDAGGVCVDAGRENLLM